MDRNALLDWYHCAARALPWRLTRDSYAVWVSEVMLQQTRAQSAIPYYTRFMDAFPDVFSLAGADEQSVLSVWQGLGYYARARKLHAAARVVAETHGGRFPRSLTDALALPGVGDYTAAAVLSIAYGERLPAVDGNALRVFARHAGLADPVDKPPGRVAVHRAMRALTDCDRPGDVNQAVMELGATVCLPRGARCGRCPVSGGCAALLSHTVDSLPVLTRKKPPLPEDWSVAVMTRGNAVLLRKRPPSGLLASMWEFPMHPGHDASALFDELASQGVRASNIAPLPDAKHVFTHKIWRMRGWSALFAGGETPCGWVWADTARLAALPVPAALSVYREIAARLISDDSPHHSERSEKPL